MALGMYFLATGDSLTILDKIGLAYSIGIVAALPSTLRTSSGTNAKSWSAGPPRSPLAQTFYGHFFIEHNPVTTSGLPPTGSHRLGWGKVSTSCTSHRLGLTQECVGARSQTATSARASIRSVSATTFSTLG